MGSAISSSAAAAAESLAVPEDTNVTAAASSHVNEVSSSSSSPTTTAATATASSNNSPRRRTARKSKATDFYAPCERVNLEAPSATAQNQKRPIMKTEKENDASNKNKAANTNNQKELEDKWENYRQELIQYKQEHDTYFVSMETNKKLARWADNQRQFYRRGKMTDVRIGLLQEIGFFDVEKPKRKSPVKTKILMKNTSPAKTKSPVKNNSSTLEDMWEENRQALIAYKNEHGTFFVSQQVDKKLARWAENQRQFHRRGEMNEARQELLQEIGFFDELSNRSPQKKKTAAAAAAAAVVSVVATKQKKRSLDELWEENRQAVIADKTENNGSFSFHPKSKLGRWVENQKRAKKLGKLSEERVTLLNEILIDQLDNDRRDEALRKSSDAMWEKTRQELIAYKEKHGDYSVPPKSKLGRWIENQKRAFKLYDMPAERAELMKEMGLFPQKPEDMVDGRSSPRKKRKTSHRMEEKEEKECPELEP